MVDLYGARRGVFVYRHAERLQIVLSECPRFRGGGLVRRRIVQAHGFVPELAVLIDAHPDQINLFLASAIGSRMSTA